ncbi:MAG TPA: MarR family transcriptional regulator [Candidatus Saccharimonadales bacterium]|nr:MarR family transcriptional regulator [Candidatus Saccharimonadales bacterium]
MSISPQQTCADLLSLLDVFKRSLRELAEEKGLTHMQIAALYTLQKQPDMLMSRMAELLHCDASNVTGIVDRLVTQGLVSRVECAHDRRAKALRVTEKGQAVIDDIMGSLPAKLGCERIAQQEREALHVAVEKIST